MIQTNQSAHRTGKGYLTFPLSLTRYFEEDPRSIFTKYGKGKKEFRNREKEDWKRGSKNKGGRECCTNDQVLNSRGQERARWDFHSSHSQRILLFQNNSYSFLSFILSEKTSHYSVFHSLFLPSSILHEDPKAEDCDLYHFEVFVLSPSSTLDSLRENIWTTTTVKRIHQHECSHKYHSHSTQVNDHIPAHKTNSLLRFVFHVHYLWETFSCIITKEEISRKLCAFPVHETLKVSQSGSEWEWEWELSWFPFSYLAGDEVRSVLCCLLSTFSTKYCRYTKRREREREY